MQGAGHAVCSRIRASVRGSPARALSSATSGGDGTKCTPYCPSCAALAKLRQASSPSLNTALDQIAPLLTWPGKPGASGEVAVEPLTTAQQAQFETGRQLYAGTCSACHQPHGLGVEGLAPPLAESEWVTGSVERLARIAINGVRGPIQVGNSRYGLDMPAWGALGDDQLAAVLTYIRREWGHTAPPVEPDTIKTIRATVADRLDAWTQPELLKVP